MLVEGVGGSPPRSLGLKELSSSHTRPPGQRPEILITRPCRSCQLGNESGHLDSRESQGGSYQLLQCWLRVYPLLAHSAPRLGDPSSPSTPQSQPGGSGSWGTEHCTSGEVCTVPSRELYLAMPQCFTSDLPASQGLRKPALSCCIWLFPGCPCPADTSASPQPAVLHVAIP